MPNNHDAVAALPTAGGADHVLLRNLLVKRMAYCLAPGDDSQDLVAVDPQSGATILFLLQNGRIYALDADDTVSAPDGTTVLVSYDGKRYKLDDLSVPYAVLDKDLTAPPDAPEIGDAYLLVGPGTGDWAGLGPIVSLTGRGWDSIALPVGRMVYVEDEDAYYHRKADGDIVAGLGIGAISNGSLRPIHFLRGGDLVTWSVVSQALQSPPASPAAGDTYIVASGGAGAWTGWDGSIARRENGAWVRYIPATGWRAYDANLNAMVKYQSPNWVTELSGYSSVTEAFASGAATISLAGAASGGYVVSTTPPTQSTTRRIVETLTISVQAQRPNQVVDISYAGSADWSVSVSSNPRTFAGLSAAVFIDNVSNAADWRDLGGGAFSSTNSAAPAILALNSVHVSASFAVTLPDTLPHTITVMLFPRVDVGTVGAGTVTLTRRRIVAKLRA